MTYTIKEIYHSQQGEGKNTGRNAIFCRFSGCNLWSGLERHRHNAICRFCDTDFVGVNPKKGGGKYDNVDELIEKILSMAKDRAKDKSARPMIILTGGEPLLQVDAIFIHKLKENGFYIALETNGTIHAKYDFDWITVSPKANAELVQKKGDELKLVWPQENINLQELLRLDFKYFFLQPMDGKEKMKNIANIMAYCHRYSEWQMSLQTHKILGID